MSFTKRYKILIEAYFVRLPKEAGVFGFFCTVYIDAIDAVHAVIAANKDVKIRIAKLGFDFSEQNKSAPAAYVKDIWTVSNPSGDDFRDSEGVTLYKMGAIEVMLAKARLLYLKRFSKNRLLFC